MKKRDRINLLLVIVAVLVVGMFAFSVRLEASPDAVVTLHADGMTCGSCAARISTALEREKGVAAVSVNAAAGRIVVSYDTKAVEPQTLARCVTTAGYGCRVLKNQTVEEYRSATGRELPVRPERCSFCEREVSR